MAPNYHQELTLHPLDKYFAPLEPRPQQIEALERIIASPASIIMVQAPPGAGKSAILFAYARYLRETIGATAHLVTPQKTLQTQLCASNYDAAKMQGTSNYECPYYERNPENHTRHDGCRYYDALDFAQRKPIVVHNNASFLYQRRHWKKRGLLCLDECHRAPSAIGSFLELSFTAEEQSVTGIYEWSDVQQWANVDLPDGTAALRRKHFQLRSFWWLYGCAQPEDLETDYEASDSSEPIDLKFKAVEGDEGITFTPTVLSPAGSLIHGRGNKCLLVSATILDPKWMSVDLGLGKLAPEYIELDSDFPPENRPIVERYCGRMSRDNEAATMPRIVQALRDDMRREHGAGIVHTVSYERAHRLAKMLNSDRVILLPRGETRERCISDFLSGRLGRGKVLVGPGLHEGIDGAGDSATWQAIIKSPYPNITDVRIAAIRERNAAWADGYCQWTEAKDLIQMLGRVVRSKEDFGTTYVYDSNIQRVLRSKLCPEYVTEAIR